MKLFAIAGLILVAGCAARHPQASRMVSVDDAQEGGPPARFEYIGKWEHIRGRTDGRSAGTSSRSRHGGDALVFPFTGTMVRLFGVRGPNGGNASVAIDGHFYGNATFTAPRKETHVLVFESPTLPEGSHVLGLVVNGDPDRAHQLYVNVDDAQVVQR